MWQDLAIALISVIFDIALIPQIIYGYKTKKKTISNSTAFITFIGLYLTTLIYFTLHLYFSTVLNFICATFWLILFVQSITYKNN